MNNTDDNAIMEHVVIKAERRYTRTQYEGYQRRVARWLVARHASRAKIRTTNGNHESEYLVGGAFVRARTLDMHTPGRVS